MTFEVIGDEVHVLCGDNSLQGIEFILEIEALREFVRRGADTLRELGGNSPVGSPHGGGLTQVGTD